MSTAQLSTGFARLSPTAARAVLAIFATTALLLIGVTLSPLRSGFADATDRGAGDLQLYRAEIGRVHAGQSYYAAAAAELPARGYPTRSVFNWRPPLLAWLLGSLPTPAIGRIVLMLLAGACLLAAVCRFARDGQVGRATLCGFLLLGALLPCALDGLFVLHEMWAGVLILLSVLAYAFRRPGWGVAAGLAALALRELAAPYCVLCGVLALIERRRFEALVWLVGAAVYGAAYAAHFAAVLPYTSADGALQARQWFSFGGAGFVISAVQVNGFLLQLPQWVSALYLALALIGFASWTAAWGRRAGLTAAMYLGAMAVVGQGVNQYWGALIAPLLCLGVAQAPAALSGLWKSAKAAVQHERATACAG